jgi:PAS domain S-box-containing protein
MTAQDLVLAGSYDYRLIAVSVVIAITASYAALDLAGRVTAARGRAWLAWLTGGATAMGIGIWSMHYTGMLAFRLPIPVKYHWPTVLLSLLAGILSSGFALLVVSRRKMGAFRAVAASIFMGGGIVALHYTFMAAMRSAAMCRYSPPLVALSVLLAIVGSLVSLWLAFLFRDEPTGRVLRKLASAVLMGTAIFTMHYTAMAAASFTRSETIPNLTHAVSISTLGTTGIALATLVVLGIAMLTCLVDRLQEQKALLDDLFEQAPQAVALMNGDNRVVRVNREFTRIFGYTPQETLGRRLSDLIVPTEFRDEFEKYAELVAHGQRVDAESVRQRKGGSSLHVLVVHVPVSMPTGKIAVYGIYHDITERKRAEEALRRSQMMFEKLFDSSPEAIVASDRQGCIARVNEQVEKIFGYRRADLLGQPIEVLVPELLRRLHSAHRENYYAQPSDRPMGAGLELYGRRADGTEFPVDILLSLIETEESPLVLSVIRDITERKRAEEQLKRSEAYLAAGQRLSHTGSWAWNVMSGDLYWSQETFRIFGFDAAKTKASVAETFLPRIHPEDRPRIEQALREAPTEAGNHEMDYRIVLPDGSIRHVHEAVYPLTNEAGQVVERYGVVRDITQSERAEEQLQRSHDQLRALTAQLQSVREEERTMVAREIHDELGQALTAIKLDVTGLVRELPADQGPAVHRGKSILKLLDETIQSVQRISTELRPGILDDLGLAAAVEWAAEDFQARTGTKCRISMSDEDITTDRERATALFRIFQETLTNAARHAKATEVSVRLAKENDNLTLEVHDNGVGIREDKLSTGKSLGILGMRERARLLGGEFTIQGVPGGGTTVRVRIPFAEPRTAEIGK